MPKIARHVIVHGRVQGVGFRYFIQRTADRLSITGNIRNCPDSTVEIYAEGEVESMSEFLAEVARGPRMARVDHLDIREIPESGKFRFFLLRDGEMQNLKAAIREIPDWPKKGILFYDVTTLLKNGERFREAIDAMIAPYRNQKIDIVVGVEARGFIFAPTVAYALGAGFVPVRKPGKLPAATHRASYDLEYGTDCLEIHQDAIQPGHRVLIVDDLIATGGTAGAVAQMIESMGAKVEGLSFLVELEFLHGRDKLSTYNVSSILKY